jgi:hypothetical protein
MALLHSRIAKKRHKNKGCVDQETKEKKEHKDPEKVGRVCDP